jgi:hypothetical protein
LIAAGRIDLYKRGCFVLESKQGVQQQEDTLVLSARQPVLRAKRKRGHATRGTAGWDDVAHFLMRCLFAMFAEDVELLPRESFRNLLRSIDNVEHVVPLVASLWRTMNQGGFSVQLRTRLLQFNGGLFGDPSALPLTRDQLDLLTEAVGADWKDAEINSRKSGRGGLIRSR